MSTSEGRIIGKWHYGLGDGRYIRYEFTNVAAYAYSNPFKMVTGTYTVQDDQLTLRPEGASPESYTFRFGASAPAASPNT